MASEARIIGVIRDAEGHPWEVREYLPTAHGFTVAKGWPEGEPRGKGGRGVAVVPTAALLQYLAATRLKDMNLPIGETAIKRLRAEAGIRWDWEIWWAERASDLRAMTLEAFAAKHGCSTGAASQRRAALLGRR